ncbi:type II 3-dehydroquinate dehydratase [Buchnera aphidicola (Pemphigus obesinymphae)]|uniref:type II 3-dehydroquinate dehydratase n=1 Tax=Buchnera aphidicola TaxID=9 RepID=UPI002237A645|nr:type II 3-dehydroquinate dehydratase [Buchnera aphidicola]MCW5196662.1 type II 3-dehydroquinate dehydratase [Buchnera aphidicola (Pemphigus obesinymphae)]
MNNKLNILLLNGPNLNLLGIREPKVYGEKKLSELLTQLNQKAEKLNVKLHHLQSNAEHILVERIHQAKDNIDYIIINPASFTHTSISLRDALLSVNIPFIEVHISNIYAREQFRATSWFSDISDGVICGFGLDGYFWSLKSAVKKIKNRLLKKH